jgi:CDP-diacylglycerol--glycerol-3-phosphate 3-phosphatidyltransferase
MGANPRARTGIGRLPDAVSLSRPFWGAACGVAVATGEAGIAGGLYLLGYLSDVLDGWLARRLGVASAAGTRIDGIADELFHLLVGLGLLWYAVTAPAWWVLLAIIAILGAVRLVRRWIAVRTVLGKVVGGITRVAMLGVFVALAPPGQRGWLVLAGIVVFGTTYAYELVVTLDEGRTGARALR